MLYLDIAIIIYDAESLQNESLPQKERDNLKNRQTAAIFRDIVLTLIVLNICINRFGHIPPRTAVPPLLERGTSYLSSQFVSYKRSSFTVAFGLRFRRGNGFFFEVSVLSYMSEEKRFR